ncbi:MAG: acyl-CoA thioesterase [Rhodovulum sulfidophilum]|uniref:Acyl-CoA thioesterase n=1 Tax=Rhodovulum sulfidophilum TaxID=35806 RepID=A0A2W5Q492_RHOSU|nr:MAG: acyl-CoA thioesterase [Rhodovulum sulfidophilum]
MEDQGFVWRRRVGFGDCDPARIAYTGRIPEFALEAIDAFWEDLLDGDHWFRQFDERGYATPFVHLEIDFSAPVTPRHPLLLAVEPTTVGNSSIAFMVTGRQDGVVCFVTRTVSVFVAIADFKKIPVPERVRAALEAGYPALRRDATGPGAARA